MAAMKFKFTIQGYQTDAVNSVVKVFSGQPFQDKVSYRRMLAARMMIVPYLTGNSLMKTFSWGLPMHQSH